MLRSFLALVALMFVALPAVAQEFPVTIKHALGEAVIPAAPQRIVTWGWSAQDAVLALGQVPVAIPFYSYGGDENGMIVWTKDEIERLGGPMPFILDNTGDAPIEQIAAQKPDLILAVYSGLTAEEYAKLSQIAPVVAYPDKPWGTSWQDTILITGKALGKAAEAEKIVADSEQFIADTVAKYPEIKGTSFAGIAEYNGEVAIYAALDARMQFLVDAGMVLAPSVNALDPSKGESFFYSISFELFDQLTTDILISYFDKQEAADAFYARPVVAGSVQVKQGAVASVVGEDYINAVSPPSALSLRWGLEHYVALIGAAAKQARE